MDLREAKKVLFIRLSSLGDVILTTPALRAFGKKYPHIQADYLVRKQYSDVVKHNPNLNSVYHYPQDGNAEQLLQTLKENNYDLIVDLQNNLRSAGVIKRLKTSSVKFSKPHIKKFLLVKFKINRLQNTPSVPERYITTVPGLEPDGGGPEIFLPPKTKPFKREKKTIGFAPGSRHFTKMWPEQYYSALGNVLANKGFKILLFGGKDDIELCARLTKTINGAENLANDNDLFATANQMQRCEAVVCNDSGMMHTAAAMGVPVVTFFGSTVREFGFAPYGVKSLIIENKGLSCRPCTHIGKGACPLSHFKCMRDLTPDLAYKMFSNFYDKL